MSQKFNLSQKLLRFFYRKVEERDVSPDLVSRDNLLQLVELAAQYTKNSDNALIYLELPLESPAPADVQFCLTECLKVPEIPNMDLTPHKKLLAYAESVGERVGADFAFDAADDYAAAPCLYGYLPDYTPELPEQFFEAVGVPAYGKICRGIINRAPADYSTYYVGFMQSRQPAYGRIGFRHTKAQERYREDITHFVRDLRALGYDKPLSPKMQQELVEAADHGFLQDTQLSVYDDGTFADRLAMDSVYNVHDRTFPGLDLIKNAMARDKIASELAKCRFAVQTFGRDAQGELRKVILIGHIQYIKCTWINGERGPLKAYLALSGKVCF